MQQHMHMESNNSIDMGTKQTFIYQFKPVPETTEALAVAAFTNACLSSGFPLCHIIVLIDIASSTSASNRITQCPQLLDVGRVRQMGHNLLLVPDCCFNKEYGIALLIFVWSSPLHSSSTA